MLRFILKWLGYAFAVIIITKIIPGFSVDSFWTALWVAVVIGLINTFIRPILLLITLPINIMTLGIFTLILNAIIMLLVGKYINGFEVVGFLNALIGAFVLSIITSLVNFLVKK